MHRKVLIYGGSTLLLGLLALAIVDNARPWRRLQAGFFELERQRLRTQLAEVRGRDGSAAETLHAALEVAEKRFESQRADVERLERELQDFRGKLRKAERRRAAARFELANARSRWSGGGKTSPEIRELEDATLEARIEIEGLRDFVENRQGRLAELRSGVVEAELAWARAAAPAAALEERLAELERGAWMRRVPVLELFQPNIAVREIRLPDARRADRCGTCHLAIDREGFEESSWPEPFRSHPRRDLFVGDDSPHPGSRFGCTVCHGGEGRSTDFERAGHPSPETPAATSRTILPAGLVEASCVGCHGPEASSHGAQTAGAGNRLIATLGCAGCHADRRTPAGLPRAGPSLRGIATKTRPAWAFHWIAAPRAFRPSTAMPHFFDLETAGDRREHRTAEILSMVAYLWERSRQDAYPPPPAGDRDAGRALFASVGCTACHLLDADARRADLYPRFERLHGPNLARTGDKVDAGWLYAWLRDPGRYRPDTPMPSLRLSEREAADLTAYLMGSGDPARPAAELPAMPGAKRDELVLAELRETLTVAASDARLEAMSDRERTLYLGERAIARHGCHGCHDVPGFENAPAPARGKLADLGRNLALPRIDGVPGDPFHPPGLSGSPDYGWEGRETEAILVNLLGWSRAGELAGRRTVKPETAAGLAILERYGCRGCHRIDGSRTNGSPVETEGAPDLSVAGAKFQPGWLFSYLRDPGRVRVRPWLTVRMPTFQWSDAAVDPVVRYFVERAGVHWFESDPRPVDERNLTVGRAVFRLLQCGRCHPGASGEEGLSAPAPAPAYELAKQRLRPGWVVAWILDPRRWDPETAMPAHFAVDGEVLPDASYLAANLSTPMFFEQRLRLERAFESDEELEEYFSDSRRVAAALRDYLWSLEN